MTDVEIVVSGIGNTIITLVLLVYVLSIANRTPALRQHQVLLVAITMVWYAMVNLKLMLLDDIFVPVDAIGHEHEAREVASYFRSGNFSTGFSYFGWGNTGFRFVLGLFYACTDAPMGLVYGINAGLSLWGLAVLLETICRVTKAVSIPGWVVVVTCASPSALFWTTGVLKEGIVLWGVCMLSRYMLTLERNGTHVSFGLPLVGFCAVAFVRPHIAAAWMVGIWVAAAIRNRRIVILVSGVFGLVGTLFVLEQLIPETMNSMSEMGVVETMNSEYHTREGIGGSSISYATGAPIPILDGLLLLFMRPYPFEVSGIDGLIAGLEIWFMTGMTLVGWLRLRDRSAVLLQPFVTASIGSLIPLAFFFSYSYNMGLMVRQRLMVFPVMLALLAVPVAVRRCQAVRGAFPFVPKVARHPLRKRTA